MDPVFPEALHMPLHTLEPAALGAEKDRPIIFYCAHGVRAGKAAAFLASQGFSNVFSLANKESVTVAVTDAEKGKEEP